MTTNELRSLLGLTFRKVTFNDPPGAQPVVVFTTDNWDIIALVPSNPCSLIHTEVGDSLNKPVENVHYSTSKYAENLMFEFAGRSAIVVYFVGASPATDPNLTVLWKKPPTPQ